MVSKIGLGTMVFGWLCDEAECHSMLNMYINSGGNLIDTANIYSLGITDGSVHQCARSEQIIGSWLSRRDVDRDKVIIATKVGNDMAGDQPGLARTAIRYHVESSLKRLQTDYIDLYQAHCDDRNTGLDETLETFQELVGEGKIRYYGCSNYSPERIREAHTIAQSEGFHGYVSSQDSYNLIIRSHLDNGIHPVAHDLGLGLIAYKPLAGGFLTGKYRQNAPIPDSPSSGVIVKRCFNEQCWKIINCLDGFASKYNTTVVQVLLAWYGMHPRLTSVLVGARSLGQVSELLARTDFDLTADEYSELDQVSS